MNAPSTNDPAGLRNAGQQALEAGNFSEAAEFFLRANMGDPDNVYGLCGLAAAQFGCGDNALALATAKRAQMISPNMAQPFFVLCPAAICAGDKAATDFCFDLVKKVDMPLASQFIKYWTKRLGERERTEEAIAAFEAFLFAHEPDLHIALQYAEILLAAFQPEKAIKFIETAFEQAPNDPHAHALRARYHVQTGAIEKARADALASIESDHDCFPAYMVLSEIDPGAIDDAMTALLDKQLKNEMNPPGVRTLAGSALGRALEAQKDYDGAFAAFSLSNNFAKQSAIAAGGGYNAASVEEALRDEAKRYPPGVFAAQSAGASPNQSRGTDLIFIIGMPRSGSTLIDQILASHSRVASAGESTALADVYENILADHAQSGGDLSGVIERRADEWERQYRTGLKLNEDASFIVDKSLQNFWFCGLIALLFPAAKIIEMHRDPMDVGLSIYRLLFFGAHPYANDFEDIAHCQKCYEAMTDYWRRTLPAEPYTVEYEKFISDFKPQVEALLDYCGLELEEACLNFHQTDRAVFTLSAAQVRKGVNMAGRGRWRAYEKHLAPLRNALQTISIPTPGQ